MKKIFLLPVLLAFVTASFAQEVVQDSSLSRDEYLKKAKKQKTWGWILTGVGTLGLTAALLADTKQVTDATLTTIVSLGYVEPEEYKSYAAVYIISGVVLASGITLFIASSKNGKKARLATAFIDMETAPTIYQAMVVKQPFPVVGIKIKL